MKYFFILFITVGIFFSSLNADMTKQLSSQDRAETFLQNLVDAGEFEKAKIFAKMANEKYKNNTTLLCWSGKAYFDSKDIETAKKYYLRAIDIDPTHPLAKIQLELIDEQENAGENKDISDVLDFLSDKGIDFLMIFLAFLGGELIAKRYSMCQNKKIYIMAEHFVNKENMNDSYKFKIKFIFNQYARYITKELLSFCSVLNILVIVTITAAIMIFVVFVGIYLDITFILGDPLLTVTSDVLQENLFLKIYPGLFVLILLIRFFMNLLSLHSNQTIYEIEFVEELDSLYERLAYTEVYDVMKFLHKSHIKEEEIRKLLIYSQYEDEIMRIFEAYESK